MLDGKNVTKNFISELQTIFYLNQSIINLLMEK